MNGVLEQRGRPAVGNREASPDGGGWSVTGVFRLNAGKNTVRLEHKSRFPYFEALLMSPLAAGVAAPRSLEQVAREYQLNPGFVERWADEMKRSQGAPHSVLFPLFAYAERGTLAAWTSAAAERFREWPPKTREELGAKYQALFDEADRQWQEVTKSREGQPKEEAERNAIKQEEGLADPVLEAFREVSYAKAGPFQAPADAKQYYAAAVRDQLDELEKEKKALELATPDLPKAMGVTESSKIADLPIHLRGSHWTLGPEAPLPYSDRGHLTAADS